jgi:hypothetical protein
LQPKLVFAQVLDDLFWFGKPLGFCVYLEACAQKLRTKLGTGKRLALFGSAACKEINIGYN